MTAPADLFEDLDLDEIAHVNKLVGDAIDGAAATIADQVVGAGERVIEMQVAIMMAHLDRVATAIAHPHQEPQDRLKILGWAVSYLCHAVGEADPA